MIYLVGVDHLVQHRNSFYSDEQVETVSTFTSYLEQEAIKHFVILIAEEFSTEAFNEFDEPVSTAQRVAEKLEIEHRFCDPTTLERTKCSISSTQDREQFWIERIQANQHDVVLFICGNFHLDSFQTRLLQAGFEAKIVSQDWGVAV